MKSRNISGVHDEFIENSGGPLTSRRALVTGGMGFIGSHLVEKLLQEDFAVTVIDNLSTGRRSNLEHLDGSRISFVEADVANLETIRPYFSGIDCVFHLAALADIVPSIQNPISYHHSNVTGTASVLEAARLAGVGQVIYTASSSCYGIPDVIPTPETASIRPEYPYALTKNLGEQIALHWGKVYKMRVNSLRLFNVYGPRSRTAGTYGAVFGIFLAQKIAGQPLTIVGDGTQTRDFTYVTDVANAFAALADSRASGEIFNVGSGGTVSVNRLAELLGGHATHIPKRPGEPDCTFADITKIRRTLGWQPQVAIEDGVARMLERIDDWRDAPVWTPDSIHEATREWFTYLSAGDTVVAH